MQNDFRQESKISQTQTRALAGRANRGHKLLEYQHCGAFASKLTHQRQPTISLRWQSA